MRLIRYVTPIGRGSFDPLDRIDLAALLSSDDASRDGFAIRSRGNVA
jgi:hypothetical protein